MRLAITSWPISTRFICDISVDEKTWCNSNSMNIHDSNAATNQYEKRIWRNYSWEFTKNGEPFGHEYVRIVLPVRVLEEHSCSYQEVLVLSNLRLNYWLHFIRPMWPFKHLEQKCSEPQLFYFSWPSTCIFVFWITKCNLISVLSIVTNKNNASI